MNIKMRRDVSRGRKSKAGGGKLIKDHRTIYIPAEKRHSQRQLSHYSYGQRKSRSLCNNNSNKQSMNDYI